MIRILACLLLLGATACGDIHPGTPGHEPPSGGTLNPVTGTRSNGG